MKAIALVVLASLSFSVAHAATIASCASVEHHGHYVEIKDDNNKITALISNDGEVVEQPVIISSISKNSIALKSPAASSWAIRQAIKGSAEVDQSGVVAIKGKLKKDSILININTYSGQHFLMRGDYVEEMKCNQEQAIQVIPELNSSEKP